VEIVMRSPWNPFGALLLAGLSLASVVGAAAPPGKEPEVTTVGAPSPTLSLAEIAKLDALVHAHPELGIRFPMASPTRAPFVAPTATVTPLSELRSESLRLPAAGPRDLRKADGPGLLETYPVESVIGGVLKRLSIDGAAHPRPAVQP
jgi:hypothetical protein